MKSLKDQRLLLRRIAVNKKKVLFVINTLGRAGAETAMITLLERLLTGEYEGLYDISLFVIIIRV